MTFLALIFELRSKRDALEKDIADTSTSDAVKDLKRKNLRQVNRELKYYTSPKAVKPLTVTSNDDLNTSYSTNSSSSGNKLNNVL